MKPMKKAGLPLAMLGLSVLSLVTARPAQAQYMYVGDYNGNQVLRFDSTTGAPDAGNPFIKTLGNTESIRGYDGVLLVADAEGATNRVGKYNVNTGAALTGPGSSFFVNTALYDIAISPDATKAYIAEDAQIASYDLATGTLLATHTTPDSWGVAINPKTGEIFTGNGWQTGAAGVYAYDANLGTQRTVVPAGDHGLKAVAGITFAKDGSFYVVNGGNFDANNGFINHYKADGTFISTMTDTADPAAISRAFAAAIGPDGNLYVTSFTGACVLKFNTATDTFNSVFVPPHGGNLVSAKTLDFSVNHINSVPEPGSVALLFASGIVGAGLFRKRRAAK